jgi:hypothetical protein
MAITVTHITIPLDIDSRAERMKATCYVKLSNDGDSESNKFIALCLLNGTWESGAGGNIMFFYGQDIPHGVNTLSLPVPWRYLYKFRETGGYCYLYRLGREPSEYQMGETFSGQPIAVLDARELPEFIFE